MASYTPTLNKLATSIKSQVNKLANATFEIGNLLNLASVEFGGVNKEFYTWADVEVGFKKSYVLRLMRIHDAFKDSDLKVLPTRVLYEVLLVSQSKSMSIDEINEMKDILIAELEAGTKVTQAVVKELAEELKPSENTTPSAPKDEPKITVSESNKRLDDMRSKFEQKHEETVKQRDEHILANRKQIAELAKANARILELETVLLGKDDLIAQLAKQIEAMKVNASVVPEVVAVPEVAEVIEVVEPEVTEETLPWATDKQNWIAKYLELKALKPRSVTTNCKEACVQIGCTWEQRGSNLFITLDGIEFNALELRKLAK